MTKYAVDKCLWMSARDEGFAQRLCAGDGSVLEGLELTPSERAAVLARDLRRLFELGAHPFLIYSAAIRFNGGFSFDFMRDYVKKLEGLSFVDIET